jgi:cullin 3
MCILMLFNENTTLTLDAIRNATNITENELRRHLLSLCTPRLKVLKKASKVKGIVDDDSFTFNSEFTSKFKRIKIPLIIEHAGNAATMAAAGNSTTPHHTAAPLQAMFV